jgi:hypothetical protein
MQDVQEVKIIKFGELEEETDDYDDAAEDLVHVSYNSAAPPPKPAMPAAVTQLPVITVRR